MLKSRHDEMMKHLAEAYKIMEEELGLDNQLVEDLGVVCDYASDIETEDDPEDEDELYEDHCDFESRQSTKL